MMNYHEMRLIHPGQKLELNYGTGQVYQPGQLITDDRLLITVIANGTLSSHNFELRPIDRQPIRVHDYNGDFIYAFDKPGVSAFIQLDETVGRGTVSDIVEKTFDRPLDRRDKLHGATIANIKTTGWQVYWVPQPSNLMHARLVPPTSPSSELSRAEALVSVFDRLA